MVGLDDMAMRNFYELPEGESYEAHIPAHLKHAFSKTPDIQHIIDRILLPEDKRQELLSRIT
jgi:hypothetical protein